MKDYINVFHAIVSDIHFWDNLEHNKKYEIISKFLENFKNIEELENDLSTLFPNNYISEVNTQLGKWLNSLKGILNKGVMIFIDYGYSAGEYYHPERMDGTLLCHYRHRVHSDPFYNIGLQDITCSVNFTAKC